MMERRKSAGAVILWIYSLATLFLLGYLVFQSLRPKSDVLSKTFSWPENWTLHNYARLFKDGNFHIYLWNSVVILALSLAVVVLLSSMAAYGIGRYEFKLKRTMTIYFLLGLMFPVQLGIVPIFLIVRSLGLIDTHLSVILVMAAGMSMPVFLLTTFFAKLPNEIYESAKMDGAGEWTTFLRIMFPLASPVVFSICIIMSVQIWNQFFVPLIFLQSERNKTIPLMIMKYTNNLIYNVDMALVASVTATIPILIGFFLFSQRILEGVAQGGVKG